MSGRSTARKGGRRAERALVRGMLTGDERAFEAFCDDYLPIMYRFTQRRLGADPELVREIVQSTVCKVIGKLESFRGEAALSTWLCACCRNEIAAHFRRRRQVPREVDVEPEELPAEAALHAPRDDGPEGRLLRRESGALVHEALDALPPHYGKALEWKYLDHLSVREIAERLELGPKAAESVLTRARRAFRDGYSRLAASVATPRALDGAKPGMVVQP